MNPSETVQAAQRLLAEREAVGLKKYGTTVDRTDLRAGEWLQHAIEEASDLLLYLLRLQQMIPRTPDSERPTLSSLAGIAPDLMPLEEQPAPAAAPEFIIAPIVCPGTPDAHTLTLKIGVQSFRISGGLDFDTRGDAEWMASQLRNALKSISQPATKALPAPAAAPEDAERAAYLARWAKAPWNATHLCETVTGSCYWTRGKPRVMAGGYWTGAEFFPADETVRLGRFGCEPRPVQGVGE